MADKAQRITFLASVGSVISGVVASLCCIGPLVFVVLGLSGAAAFAQLEQYRWLFGGLALGFLAIGFFFTYRGGEECGSGTSCVANPSRRKLNKAVLWIATVLVLIAIFLPNIVGLFIS